MERSTEMNIFYHANSIRQLKNKLYTNETGVIDLVKNSDPEKLSQNDLGQLFFFFERFPSMSKSFHVN
jgi:sulfur relay (sulfurtransferase) DsrF/TusC family protein